jgi:hypothetical protein
MYGCLSKKINHHKSLRLAGYSHALESLLVVINGLVHNFRIEAGSELLRKFTLPGNSIIISRVGVLVPLA